MPSKIAGKSNSMIGTIQVGFDSMVFVTWCWPHFFFFQSRIGGFLGFRNYAANGRDRHMHGEAEYKAAKGVNYAS